MRAPAAPCRPSRDGFREVGRLGWRAFYGPARTGRVFFASRCRRMQGCVGWRVRPLSGRGAQAARRRSAAENANGPLAPALRRGRWRVPRPFPSSLPPPRPIARGGCGRQGSMEGQHSGAEPWESSQDFRTPPAAFRAFSGTERGRQSNSSAARTCARSWSKGRRDRNSRGDSRRGFALLFCFGVMVGSRAPFTPSRGGRWCRYGGVGSRW